LPHRAVDTSLAGREGKRGDGRARKREVVKERIIIKLKARWRMRERKRKRERVREYETKLKVQDICRMR
jgi:hypothetical protein